MFGYVPDPPALRGRYRQPLGYGAFAEEHAPQEVDNSALRLPILDQGSTQSCIGHGTSQILHVCARRNGFAWLQSPASPRALYRDARSVMRRDVHDALRDEGAMPSAVITAMEEFGIYPFDGTMSDITPTNVNNDATIDELCVEHRKLLAGFEHIELTDYAHVSASVKRALASGYVLGVGINVTEEWERWTGYGAIEARDGETLGGHWLCCDGYEQDAGGSLVLRGPNSWGSSWGDRGEWRCTLRSLWARSLLLQVVLFGQLRLKTDAP